MPQWATLTPDGGIPADCTAACSGEQVLLEPYTHLLSHMREETALRWNCTGLRAAAATRRTTAIALPLKRRGVRRAKAPFCHTRQDSQHLHGIWQDGGVLIERRNGEIVACVTTFETQSLHTNRLGLPI
jgi:hypothetical protein